MISFKSAPLQHCLQIIVNLCDGASKRDGYGFNRYDAEYGHVMATIAQSSWSLDDQVKVYFLLRKYQRQLLEQGIEFSSIPKPEMIKANVVVERLDSLGRF